MAVAISESGLQFFGKMITKILDEKLPQIDIPQFAAPINSGPGSGTLYLKYLEIRNFDTPTIQFDTKTPFILSRSQHGQIEVTGDWYAEYNWLITWNPHGTLLISLSDLESSIMFNVHGKDGHPQVRIHNCNVNLQDINVLINGGGFIGWVIRKFFSGTVNDAVKDALNNQLCQNLETTFLEQLNNELCLKAKHINVGHDIRMDYDLAPEAMSVNSTHVFAQSYVGVVLGGQGCRIPTSPLKISQVDDSFMSNMWIGETIPNCLLWSAHNTENLHFMLSRNVYSKLDTFLATNCSFYKPCIGKLFPKIAERHPNRHIQMNFHSASSPTVNFAADTGVDIQSTFFVDWKIQSEPDKQDVNETLAQLHMELLADVEPIIYEQRLSGQVISTYVKFTEIYSNIGEFHSWVLKNMDWFLSPAIQIGANNLLRKGVPIPLVEGVELTNGTVLSVEDDAIRCNADFAYVD